MTKSGPRSQDDFPSGNRALGTLLVMLIQLTAALITLPTAGMYALAQFHRFSKLVVSSLDKSTKAETKKKSEKLGQNNGKMRIKS